MQGTGLPGGGQAEQGAGAHVIACSTHHLPERAVGTAAAPGLPRAPPQPLALAPGLSDPPQQIIPTVVLRPPKLGQLRPLLVTQCHGRLAAPGVPSTGASGVHSAHCLAHSSPHTPTTRLNTHDSTQTLSVQRPSWGHLCLGNLSFPGERDRAGSAESHADARHRQVPRGLQVYPAAPGGPALQAGRQRAPTRSPGGFRPALQNQEAGPHRHAGSGHPPSPHGAPGLPHGIRRPSPAGRRATSTHQDAPAPHPSTHLCPGNAGSSSSLYCQHSPDGPSLRAPRKGLPVPLMACCDHTTLHKTPHAWHWTGCLRHMVPRHLSHLRSPSHRSHELALLKRKQAQRG